MAVRILTEDQKIGIVMYHRAQQYTQKQIAELYRVSERTINRVLNERGVATAVPRIKGEAYQVMQLLKKYNLQARDLEVVIQEGLKHVVGVIHG